MKFLPLVSIYLLSLTACTSLIGPGSKPGEIPPQIAGETKCKHWDHPEYFGPVPAQLQSKGNELCRQIGAERATGYHPNAKDYYGRKFDGGGYYCEGGQGLCTDNEEKHSASL